MTPMCCEMARPSSGQWARIERIAALTPCRRGYVCLRPHSADLIWPAGNASDGVGNCLEPRGAECNLGILLQERVYCACLVRLYVARRSALWDLWDAPF